MWLSYRRWQSSIGRRQYEWRIQLRWNSEGAGGFRQKNWQKNQQKAQEIHTELWKVLSMPSVTTVRRAENKHSTCLLNQSFILNKTGFAFFKISSAIKIVWDKWKPSENSEWTCMLVLLQVIGEDNAWMSRGWLSLFLSTGDSVHLISLVFLQCQVELEVAVGTTWGLMSIELRSSLFHVAERWYIIRFHLWSKSKLIFHVPLLYATYKRLLCFKRKILC